ncbi:MAG: hypothetical protein L0Z62_03590 [Gemmataceae bacterium]|nr:hypothetical protein [Gemmataceae bacterium]
MSSQHVSLEVVPRSTPRLPRTALLSGPWLFSAPLDLSVFLGSALASLALVGIGAWLGLLDTGTPDWTWIPAVLLIDVAHVWATGFRVYFDPHELRRRPWLYALVPLLGFLLGVALYSEGELVFWRALAYLAVFHFVRQQSGWVALYRARAGERGQLGRWIDTAAIYLATVYPLIYWHCHLPRHFWWFLRGDFAALPTIVEQVARPLYVLALGIYGVRAGYLWLVMGRPNLGKDIVVATTAVCWYVGIVVYDSDYAFTVTNVIIHGVPYLALVYWYRYLRRPAEGRTSQGHGHRLVAFLATLWLLAYVEEMLWDRGVWQERSWLFGSGWDVASVKFLVVPLLALPQLTHYVLDGFIWRRRSNPDLALLLADASVAGEQEAVARQEGG